MSVIYLIIQRTETLIAKFRRDVERDMLYAAMLTLVPSLIKV